MATRSGGVPVIKLAATARHEVVESEDVFPAVIWPDLNRQTETRTYDRQQRHRPAARFGFPAEAHPRSASRPTEIPVLPPYPPRTANAQATEVVLACSILNRMTGLGRSASFGVES